MDTGNVAELGFAADTTQLKSASGDLQNLSDQALKAEQASRVLAESFKAMSSSGVSQATNQSAQGLENVAKAAVLSRTEFRLLNESARLAADAMVVGIPPMQLMAMEAFHLSHVLGTEGASGFFNALKGSILALISPMVLLAGGAATVAAAGVYMAYSWEQGQATVTRSIIGLGAATGTTIDQINEAATKNASAWEMSVREAQVALAAYTATGKIGIEQAQNIAAITRQVALAMGTSVEEATKLLAESFNGTLKGADALDAKLGILTGTMRNQIAVMEAAGNRGGIQQILTEATTKATALAAVLEGPVSRAWRGLIDTASSAASAIGKALDITKLSDVSELQSRIAILENIKENLTKPPSIVEGMVFGGDPGRGTAELAKVEGELGRLRAALTALRGEMGPGMADVNAESKALAQLGRAFTDGSQGAAILRAETERLDVAINQYLQGNTRLLEASGLTVQAALRARDAREQQADAEERLVQFESRLAGIDLSSKTAKEAQEMRLNALATSQAVGATRMLIEVEQYRQQLVMKGEHSGAEVEYLATLKLKELQAPLIASAQERLYQLKNENQLIQLQNEMLEARTPAQRLSVQYEMASVKAQQLYNDELRKGTPEIEARKLAAQYLQNENDKLDEQAALEEKARAEMERQAAIQRKMAEDQAMYNESLKTTAEDYQKIADAIKQDTSALEAANQAAQSSSPGSPGGSGDEKAYTSTIGGEFGDLCNQTHEDPCAAWNKNTKALNQSTDVTIENSGIIQDNTAALIGLSQFYSGKQVGYFHAASGLYGEVKGPGGTDSVPVHIMATPGEKIAVGFPGADGSWATRGNEGGAFHPGGTNGSWATRGADHRSVYFNEMLGGSVSANPAGAPIFGLPEIENFWNQALPKTITDHLKTVFGDMSGGPGAGPSPSGPSSGRGGIVNNFFFANGKPDTRMTARQVAEGFSRSIGAIMR